MIQAIVHIPGVVSTNVPDSFNKVFVGGLPAYLQEEQIQELFKNFGELKAFNLVWENGNGPSKVQFSHERFMTESHDIAGTCILRICGHVCH